MIDNEKGALKMKNNEIQQSFNKSTEANSNFKNSKIDDFFPNKSSNCSKESKEFSSKKRTRSVDNNDDINLILDDLLNSKPEQSQSNQTNIQIKGNSSRKSPWNKKKKHIKLKNSTDSKTKGSPSPSDSRHINSETIVVNKSKKNRDVCSICRDGGELILCDNCPKSFHLNCLKLKQTDIPDDKWFCPGCIPILEKRRVKVDYNSADEKRKIKNEKRRLYRLKKKEEMKKMNSFSGKLPHPNTKSSFRSLSKNNSRNKPLNLNKILLNENVSNSILQTKNTSYPLVPVVSSEIQNKILEQKERMENSLHTKLKGGIVIGNINNSILRNFLMGGNSYKSEQNDKILDSESNFFPDASYPNPHSHAYNYLNNSKSNNCIPTDEEARKTLESLTKNNMVDFTALNELSTTNPILYSKINAVYANSLNNKNNSTKRIYRYPIEDNELYMNPEFHGVDKKCMKKPEGRKILIPNDSIPRVFKIWDFLHSFRTRLGLSSFSPEQLYIILTDYREMEFELVNDIHVALLKLIEMHLKDRDLASIMTNEEKDLIFIKITLNNANLSQNKVLRKCWPEIIHLIISSQSPIFNIMVTPQLVELSNRLVYLDSRSFNLTLTVEEKLMLLEYLVNTVMNLDPVRSIVKEDIEKRIQLNRHKSDLQNELKNNEARKREIERQERFTQPRMKIEMITKKLETLVEDNSNLSRSELTKIRKEMEQEREQFKAVIKESEEIDVIKIKINLQIEKISNEIYEIPTTNKKHIGDDGLNNKYYFYPALNTKLYMKKFIPSYTTNNKHSKIVSAKSFEWREFSTREELDELMDCLSEKGIKEKNLLNKLNKLRSKRLNMQTKVGVGSELATTEDPAEILKSALEWTSCFNVGSASGEDSYDDTVNNLINLEKKISEYLIQDDKEWESFDVRRNWCAWVDYIRDIKEYSKCLLLFNEKFKTPYKMCEETGRKKIIIDDDDNNYQYSIINNDNKLDPYKVNPNRTIASKSKLWSRELESLEEEFITYVLKIRSRSSLDFAIFIFDSVFSDLVRRREIYKRKENSEVFDEDYYNGVNLNITNAVNNTNIFTNIPANNPIQQVKKSKNLDFDDYRYEENSLEIYIESKKYKNESSIYEGRTRSNKLRLNQNFVENSNYQNNTKKKNIDWNEECYICEDYGNVMCCEDCPNVVHLSCLKIKKQPELWRCEDCIYKMANKRQTRSSNIK